MESQAAQSALQRLEIEFLGKTGSIRVDYTTNVRENITVSKHGEATTGWHPFLGSDRKEKTAVFLKELVAKAYGNPPAGLSETTKGKFQKALDSLHSVIGDGTHAVDIARFHAGIKDVRSVAKGVLDVSDDLLAQGVEKLNGTKDYKRAIEGDTTGAHGEKGKLVKLGQGESGSAYEICDANGDPTGKLLKLEDYPIGEKDVKRVGWTSSEKYGAIDGVARPETYFLRLEPKNRKGESTVVKVPSEKMLPYLRGLKAKGKLQDLDIRVLGTIQPRAPGKTVASFIDGNADVDAKTFSKQSKSIGTKLLDKLDEIHSRGMLHQDLHLNNIVYDSATDRLTLIDLERSRKISKDEKKNEYYDLKGAAKLKAYDWSFARTAVYRLGAADALKAGIVRRRDMESENEQVQEAVFKRVENFMKNDETWSKLLDRIAEKLPEVDAD